MRAYNKKEDGKTPFEAVLLHALKYGNAPWYTPDDPQWKPKVSLAIDQGIKKGFFVLATETTHKKETAAILTEKGTTAAILTEKGTLEAIKIAFLHSL